MAAPESSWRRRAARLAPESAEATFLLGPLASQARDLDETIELLRHVLAEAPGDAGLLTDLGSLLVARASLGDAELGLLLLERAVAVAPRWSVAHVNLGVAWMRRRRMDGALACFREAQRVEPTCHYAVFCESHVHLALGDYERGFALHHAQREIHPVRFRDRRWDGRQLGGGTLLLHAQHGLGDTLQFVRYARRAAERDARVVLFVQPPLVRLLRGCPGAAEVRASDEDAGRFDAQASLLDLPAIFGDTLATIPAEVPYLAADAGLREAWAARLAGHVGLQVGLAWRGNRKQLDGLVRSCALSDMAPIWRVPRVGAVSLQAGAGSAELAHPIDGRLPDVRDLGPLDREAGAFMDTAAVMASLDLVVTVDTSVAHLAGALGRPTWLVLPYCADWRWMIDRADSPWYPTMRIFRQPAPGAWAPVFDEVARELARWSPVRRQPAPVMVATCGRTMTLIQPSSRRSKWR